MTNPEILIIGQGPAGLSAAIYTARAGLATLVLGTEPKVAGDYDIDNYFGFPETISGKELIGGACPRRKSSVSRSSASGCWAFISRTPGDTMS